LIDFSDKLVNVIFLVYIFYMGRSGGKNKKKHSKPNKTQNRSTFKGLFDPEKVDIVHSREEWEEKKKAGTLHPDGKMTIIQASEEDFAKVLEDRDRVARGKKPKHATPPKPGDTPPWAR